MIQVNPKRMLFVTFFIGVVAVAVLALANLQTAQATEAAKGRTLAFDIAENGLKFVFDETPVHADDGLPAYGGEFVTQGYIYPAGTLTCDDNGCNGVNDDGTPEFPDKVISEWTCWSFHVGDGAHTATGPIVVTTQLYSLGDAPGSKTIVTTGYELADQYLPFLRAIVGGTGPYAPARGEQTQTFLGFNNTDVRNSGVVLRVELKVQR
jgi:hypothetical protein